MLQINELIKSSKAMLLVSTSIVAIGCTTTSESDVSSSAPEKAPTEMTASSDYSGEFSVNRMMRMADKSYKKGNTQTALRLYTLANNKDPNDPRPKLAVAKIFRKSGKTPEAMSIYKQIADKHPKLAEVHNGIGYTYLAEDKPYLAAKSFEYSVSLDNGNAKSLGGLAVALDTAGEHAKAQDYYRLAIKADPNNLTYQNNLALSLALSGRVEQAIAMFEVITAHPNATAQHRQNLALVYGMAGKAAEAMRYSRMDLNESDARNNALYFQALNGTSSQPVAVAEVERKSSVSNDPLEQETDIQVTEATTTIEAKQETVALSTNPAAKEPETAPLVMMARTMNEVAETAVAEVKEAPIENEVVASVPSTPKEKRAPAYKSSMRYVSAPLAASELVAAKPEPVAEALEEKPVLEIEATKPVSEEPKLTAKPISFSSEEFAEFSSPVINKAGYSFNPAQTLYYVQVASFKKLELAKQAWQEVSKGNEDVLADFTPVFVRADLGEEKGVYYRVRIGGFANKTQPTEICETLKSRDTDCYLPRVKAQVAKSNLTIASSDPANDLEPVAIAAKAEPKPEPSQKFDGEFTAHVNY